jgi:hypothetical protein
VPLQSDEPPITATESTTVDQLLVARYPLTRWRHSSQCVALASGLLTLRQEVAALEALSANRRDASLS